jgi:hypothetical protein
MFFHRNDETVRRCHVGLPELTILLTLAEAENNTKRKSIGWGSDVDIQGANTY